MASKTWLKGTTKTKTMLYFAAAEAGVPNSRPLTSAQRHLFLILVSKLQPVALFGLSYWEMKGMEDACQRAGKPYRQWVAGKTRYPASTTPPKGSSKSPTSMTYRRGLNPNGLTKNQVYPNIEVDMFRKLQELRRKVVMAWVVLTSTKEHFETLCVLAVQLNRALVRNEQGGVFAATYYLGKTVRIEYKLVKMEVSHAEPGSE